MIKYVLVDTVFKTQLTYNNDVIDFDQPFAVISMVEEVNKILYIDVLSVDRSELYDRAILFGFDIQPNAKWGEIIEAIFAQRIETRLFQPTHVVDFPADISPLAKRQRNDPRLVERFETYIAGMEIANAFSELNDPEEQRKILQEQAQARGDNHIDDDFIEALEYGCPPMGGMGVGIDRLVMILTNSSSIRDIITFPTLRKK